MTSLAMWSGPRNISTAMMYAFGNRSDCVAWDEPFYAFALVHGKTDHPMREAIVEANDSDWTSLVRRCLAPAEKPLFYQKHMTHHMLDGVGMEWTEACRSAFLIRDPAAVLASYTVKRAQVTLADIGIVRQRELFEREADRLGVPPPVMEGRDVLADPERVLGMLCDALGVPFRPEMLSWPSGPRDTDGVWAPAWYDAVERSTGFEPPGPAREISLSDDLRRIADQARPHYEALAAHVLQ